MRRCLAASLVTVLLVYPVVGLAQTDPLAEAAKWRLKLEEEKARLARARRIQNDQVLPEWDSRHELKSLNLNSLNEGDVGRLAFDNGKVLQVLGKTEALISFGDKLLWLQEYPADKLSDGEDVVVRGLVRIGETKTYKTSTSSNTVFTFRLLTAKEQTDHDYPTWTSKTGSKVQAKFVRYGGGKVQLLKPDGKKLFVALRDFANEDADRLRKIISNRGKKPKN